MSRETLRAFAAKLPGVTEEMKWGADLCFCVHGKMFAVYGVNEGGLSFKSDPETFAALLGIEGIVPAPYVAKYHWVLLQDPWPLSTEELAAHFSAAYRHVVAKLPKKVQDELSRPTRAVATEKKAKPKTRRW